MVTRHTLFRSTVLFYDAFPRVLNNIVLSKLNGTFLKILWTNTCIWFFIIWPLIYILWFDLMHSNWFIVW